MRHRVMYSDSADPNSHDQSFRLHEDAIEFAENMLKQHRFVWLSEYGIYRNRGGRRLTSWIYYWWSPAVAKTEWGTCPDAGWGRPHGLRSLIKYEPLLYKALRLAHLNVRASPMGKSGPGAPSSQTERVLTNTQQHHALAGVDSDRQAVS
jgi:hypothetical protein